MKYSKQLTGLFFGFIVILSYVCADDSRTSTYDKAPNGFCKNVETCVDELYPTSPPAINYTMCCKDFGNGTFINPTKVDGCDQDAVDKCFMKLALDFGIAGNPARPYGALIANESDGSIKCYGVNRGAEWILYHGETSAIRACRDLYPSPTGDDVNNPGLNYPELTLYTTGEPCPMCTTAAYWRQLGRIVYGSSIPTLARMGSQQVMISSRQVLAATAPGNFNKGTVVRQPFLKGGVLVKECDEAFRKGFNKPVSTRRTYPLDEDVFYTSYDL